MKLPPLKRILKSDLADATNTLNNFLQVVWQALDRRLSLRDNLDVQLVDLDVTGGSQLQISTTLGRPLTGIVVLAAQSITSPLTGGVTVDWRQVENVIKIQQITGLTAGEPYKVRLMLL